MAERFDIAVNPQILAEITFQIRNGLAVLLFRESHTKSCFKVTFQEQVFAVVYSHKYKTPITAMPLEWAKKKAKLLKMEAASTPE